jgi:hypothetical protein
MDAHSQGNLFQNSQSEEADLEAQVGVSASSVRLKEWSYSRRETFEKCQRLYYYQYYGGSARCAKADPLKQKLRFLKGISNRYLRAGGIMHAAISCTLRARANGREWSSRFLLEFARKKCQEDLAFSRAYKEGMPLSDELSGPALLMEIYYGMSETERLCREVEEKLADALQAFQTAAEYLPFRMGVDDGQAKIESPISVKHKDITLRGKVDLAFRQNQRVNIVDWKMGKGDGGEDSLQLLFYALWAIQAFDCEPDEVDLYKAYLGDRTVSRYDFGPKAIDRAKARIAQDTERMRAVDEYGRNGLAIAFSPCGQERVCAGCVFQGVCPRE